MSWPTESRIGWVSEDTTKSKIGLAALAAWGIAVQFSTIVPKGEVFLLSPNGLLSDCLLVNPADKERLSHLIMKAAIQDRLRQLLERREYN
jgi:hypothetical protein